MRIGKLDGEKKRKETHKEEKRGKKCPGGYWIPQKYRCGGKKRLKISRATGAALLGIAAVGGVAAAVGLRSGSGGGQKTKSTTPGGGKKEDPRGGNSSRGEANPRESAPGERMNPSGTPGAGIGQEPPPLPGEYIPEGARWVAEGSLPRSEVDRICKPMEDQICREPVEWAALIHGRSGQTLVPLKTDGKPDMVSLGIDDEWKIWGNIGIHNHPDKPGGEDGGSFSPNDILFSLHHRCEFRVVSKEWVRSVRRDSSDIERLEGEMYGRYQRKTAEDPAVKLDEIKQRFDLFGERMRERMAVLEEEVRVAQVQGREPPKLDTHDIIVDLTEGEFKDLNIIYESRRRIEGGDPRKVGNPQESGNPQEPGKGRGRRRRDAYSACAQIRADAVFLRDLERNERGQVKYRGEWYTPNEPRPATQKGKKRQVLATKEGKAKLVAYGAKGYKHNYSEEAKANYLKRAGGIRDKSGKKTKDDKFSANYWAMKDLWPRNEPADGSAKNR